MQSGWFPGVGNLQGWEALPTGRGDYWVRVWMRGEEPQFFRDPMTGVLHQVHHDKRIKIGFSCKPRTRWLGLCSTTGKRLRVLTEVMG